MISLQFNMFLLHIFVALFLLIGARIPLVRTLRWSSQIETSLEEKLNATFSSADNLQWDIQSQNTTFLKLKVDRIYVNNNLTYPGSKLSLSVYNGSCSQRSNQLNESSQSFAATSNGHLCLFYPATKDAKNISIFITINTVNVTAQLYQEIEEQIKTDPSCPKQKIFDVIKSGIITSPGFEKGRYPPNKNCEYILRIPANRILQITFSSFSLEGSKICNDSLTIYRKTSSLHQIGKWCGNKKPNDIFVKGPEIVIRFNSNQQIERRGFRLQYSITEQHSQGCGKRQVAFQSNIFNGNVVRSSLKWPWIVSVYKSDFAHCAGAILNENWILTAAHCISDERQFLWETVGAGNSKITNTTAIEVSEMFRHPKFDRFFNDIAMIRLKTPLTMSDTIQPICFKDFDMESLQDCHTAGWGVTGSEYISTEELNEAKVDIWDKHSCKNNWGSIYRDTMICARGVGSACMGDSGSPLMCSDQSGSRWSVVGVTSFGRRCSTPNNIPVYANVSSYTNWIQQIMSNFPENYPKCSLDYPSLCSPNNFVEKSNNYLELPEFSCNFNNASTCNYKLNREAKWTTKSDPLDPKNSYLVIKTSYRETTDILPPRFNKNVGTMTGSMCLTFIYKIQSEYRAQITVLTEGISRIDKRNIVWISKKIGHWDKVRIILNDPRIFQFYLKIYSIGNAVYSIDDISLIDGKC